MVINNAYNIDDNYNSDDNYIVIKIMMTVISLSLSLLLKQQ